MEIFTLLFLQVPFSSLFLKNHKFLIVFLEGSIFSWGEGNYGQLGHGAAISQYNKPLIIGKPLEGKVMVQLACGANHTAALTS